MGELITWTEDNEFYRDMYSARIEKIIKTDLQRARDSFVSIGFFLKLAAERKIYAAKGYADLWEYALKVFGISRSSASRFMAINT